MMRVHTTVEITPEPMVRLIPGHPGWFSIAISNSGYGDSIHASRAEFAAWTAAVLAQMDAQ